MKCRLLISLIAISAFFASAKGPDFAVIERLGDPLDSLHNPALYLDAIEQAISNPATKPDMRARLELMAQSARKNQPGTTAADITFVTPDDSTHLLSDFRGSLTLIFFNDPDCESCALVKQRIAHSSVLNGLITNHRLRIVGIYPFSDERLWRQTEYPPCIINGWDRNGDIMDRETYVLPTFPLFYLIDSHGIVQAKDEPSLNRITKLITSLTTQ